MAYIADVENALVNTLASTLFPSINYRPGDLQPSAAGPQVRLYRGWPTAAFLDADLAQGAVGENPISAFVVNVTVFPGAQMARDTTRYLSEWVDTTPAQVSAFTASVAGNAVAFGGTYSAYSVVGVSYGHGVPQAFAYRLKSTDTPSSVAALFATKFPIATLAGTTLTFPDTVHLTANVLVDGSAMLEVKRQTQSFRLTTWAPTPAARDAVASYIDVAMATVRALALPDGSLTGKPEYRGTMIDDVPQKAREFRADMTWCVEYATTSLQLTPRMLFGDLTVTPDGGPTLPVTVTILN